MKMVKALYKFGSGISEQKKRPKVKFESWLKGKGKRKCVDI